MGICWNCGTNVFLKEEETHCDRCKEVVRYWCMHCKQPFDVQDKETKKKVRECKWCGYFICPTCQICKEDCPKEEHALFIKRILNGLISIDKYAELNSKVQKIIDYFEDIKLGRDKTTCEFGVPKTYAKEKIKQILARMDGFKVRDDIDQKAFERRFEEVLDEELGYEFTIGNTRVDGTYGQEYRDVFNLCVCLGKLKYKRKSFINNEGIKISYDIWIRVEKLPCEFFDKKEIIVKHCPQCKKVFSREKTICDECSYKTNYKEHKIGESKNIQLIEKVSDNPTCKNLSQFKRKGEDDGKGELEGND